MHRGTTPTFTLTVPNDYDLTDCGNIYATFEQNQTSVTKSGEDIDVSAHSVDVYLDQSETLMFRRGALNIQLNFTFAGGQRACTEIKRINIEDNLLPEVLP